MRNIEIHGLSKADAHNMAKKIFKTFSDEPLKITISPTLVSDRNWFSQPFLRLVSTPKENNTDILVRLQKLGMDVEYLQLKRFYLKKLMCQEKDCGGMLDVNKKLRAKTGPAKSHLTPSYPCKKCGRLHHISGELLPHFSGKTLFLKKDGKTIGLRKAKKD